MESNDYAAIGMRIRQARKMHGLSQTQLGQRIGYTKSSISEWETGSKPIGLDSLQKIAAALKKDVSYFVAGGSPSISRQDLLMALQRPVMDILPVKPVPLVGRIHAGLPWHVEEARDGEFFVPQELPVDFALKVRGDSMIGANVKEGDIVLCQSVRAGAVPKSGDMVVALVNGDEATLKFLVHEHGQWILRAANPDYADHVLLSREAPEIQAVVLRIESTPIYRLPSGLPPDDRNALDLTGLSDDQQQLVRQMVAHLKGSAIKVKDGDFHD